MAMAMLAAVKECIVRMIDLNVLNQNGVAPVRLTSLHNCYVCDAYITIRLYDCSHDTCIPPPPPYCIPPSPSLVAFPPPPP